ncbi:3-methyladenine DNA glycosylase/8-oxoguanine DNA glycosylase [Isoptericola jiangsuensis]|uniref:3-methyladenine DNA glycosylase/8-oxoguanine DNA glycosylase n=1 Tax=Isoptericola jiangsuensis TaxID=548579 RepID=A0A2A9EYI4_9MICO|nr:DNA-3-methyladenine glycosylase 2 family protein [Isoptericola jiangsuensis]PFG43591.1 3-methyladenine DNA glycosylase/8-oxoguanine DNA glycosylase [Isoptericola jiangsuensis]
MAPPVDPHDTGDARPPTADVVHTWRPDHPTDVVTTLAPLRRGRRDPTHQVAGRAVWRTTLTDAGPATTLLTPGDDGTITCRAWGEGARAAVGLAPDLCGASDDPTGFAPDLPLLADLHRRYPAVRVPRSGRVLEALVPAIIEQRVIGVQAQAGWRQLVARFGTPAPGPTPVPMRVVPSARQWARLPVWEWHRAGIDPGRARTVTRCAEVAPSLERLAALAPPEAAVRMMSLPGVGVWTAAEVGQRALGDADALSVGDFHLARVVGQVLAGRPFDDAEMVATLEPYRPHRGRVVRLLEVGGLWDAVPRRSPRPTFVDHRRH